MMKSLPVVFIAALSLLATAFCAQADPACMSQADTTIILKFMQSAQANMNGRDAQAIAAVMAKLQECLSTDIPKEPSK